MPKLTNPETATDYHLEIWRQITALQSWTLSQTREKGKWRWGWVFSITWWHVVCAHGFGEAPWRWLPRSPLPQHRPINFLSEVSSDGKDSHPHQSLPPARSHSCWYIPYSSFHGCNKQLLRMDYEPGIAWPGPADWDADKCCNCEPPPTSFPTVLPTWITQLPFHPNTIQPGIKRAALFLRGRLNSTTIF